MSTNSGGPSRRTLVKGAAWSVPVVATAGSVPAQAASPQPEPGLNGWVVINRESGDCIRWWSWGGCRERECAVRYDGYRNGDAYYGGDRLGLWVWDAESSEITTPPTLTFHLPYPISYWEAENGNSDWSLPVATGQDSQGFYLYTTTYSGGYTDGTGADGLPEVVLTGRPHFLGHPGTSCSGDRRQKITRAVGINGEMLAFTREVSFPQNNYYLDQQDTAPQAESSTAGVDEAVSTAGPDTGSDATVPSISEATPDLEAPVEPEEVIEYITG